MPRLWPVGDRVAKFFDALHDAEGASPAIMREEKIHLFAADLTLDLARELPAPEYIVNQVTSQKRGALITVAILLVAAVGGFIDRFWARCFEVD